MITNRDMYREDIERTGRKGGRKEERDKTERVRPDTEAPTRRPSYTPVHELQSV
jgi:hypothetical protein